MNLEEAAQTLSDAQLPVNYARLSAALRWVNEHGSPAAQAEAPDIATKLGVIEREMERRGIRHDG